MTMRLEPTSELMSAYLDGELTAAEQVLVEQAMRDDPDVRRTHDELRALRVTLQSMPRYEPEADLTERIMRQAERTMLAGGRPDGGTDGPSSPGQESPSTGTQAAIAPAASAHAAPWRSWSVALSVIGGLAALLLIALWLPDSPNQFEVARNAADAGSESAPHAWDEERGEQQDGVVPLGKAGAWYSGASRGRPASDEELAEQAMPAEQVESRDGLAAGLGGNVIAPRGASPKGESAIAESAEMFFPLQAPEESKVEGSTPKGVDDQRSNSFSRRSETMPNRAAVIELDQGVSKTWSGQPDHRFDVPPPQPAQVAVQLRSVDAKQLIDQLDAQQMLYVQVNFTGAEVPPQDGPVVTWLGQKLVPGLADDAFRRTVRLAGSRGIPAEPHSAVDEFVVAEGSADQIRAAITNLAALDGVEFNLAASSNEPSPALDFAIGSQAPRVSATNRGPRWMRTSPTWRARRIAIFPSARIEPAYRAVN